MLQWEKYLEVANRYRRKAKRDDSEDLSQSIILQLARVELRYNGSGRTLTEPAMFRVASYTVAQYWREHFKRTQGIDCSRCSKPQRHKCQQNLTRYAECPKRRVLVSLNSVVAESDGDEVELIDCLADDKAIDLDQWLDERQFLLTLPTRLVKLAFKKSRGFPLSNSERIYFYRVSKKAREQLLQPV